LTASKLAKALKKDGFVLDRVRGSHHIFWHDVKRLTVAVPFHGRKDLGKGLVRGIIRDAGLTREEFLKLLRK